MRVVTTVRAMAALALTWRQAHRPVGLVPTMGYLHEGHLSLVRRARRAVGKDGLVVLSLYVNPTQFGPGEDLDRYPRDLNRDRTLCRATGVDLLFAPSDAAMYRNDHSTYVVEETLSSGMEGASRPTHFRGVTTVVTKLLNLVRPDVAVFGEKDWQQAAVVRRMIRDLNLPVRLVIGPTRREPDGLAMSSRNVRLNPRERADAVALWHTIREARRRVRSARGALAAGKLSAALRHITEDRPSVRLDYIAFFDPATLQPVQQVKRGMRMAVAAWVGRTRLIDNGRL
jgi:pantoate--beta-alanine ligase